MVMPCLVSCVGMRMNSNARISWHCMDGYSFLRLIFFSFYDFRLGGAFLA